MCGVWCVCVYTMCVHVCVCVRAVLWYACRQVLFMIMHVECMQRAHSRGCLVPWNVVYLQCCVPSFSPADGIV